MIVNAIYHEQNQVHRVYHGNQLIFQGMKPVQFHVIEDGKLIIRGAKSMRVIGDALYLDCSPNVEWNYPVVENGVLKIRQAHTATMNGSTLEVR